MKRTGHYYEVKDYDGTGGILLTSYTHDVESFEAVVDAILYAENMAAAAGYQPSKYIIVRVDWEREDNGVMFLSETTTRKTVATYDGGVVTEI